jgi:hypothetical protein
MSPPPTPNRKDSTAESDSLARFGERPGSWSIRRIDVAELPAATNDEVRALLHR